jgi:hypothetical protein
MASEKLDGDSELYRFKETETSFSGICVLVFKDNKVTIKGLCSKIDSGDRRELSEYLESTGVSECFYERRKASGVINKRWPLNQRDKKGR